MADCYTEVKLIFALLGVAYALVKTPPLCHTPVSEGYPDVD